ncbi:protein TIFY 3-like [Gastrolobium bilobum]|uniref:protein TIFY 3-like n=1 Tax=Gastrolobium bilobum TaxID=150636 RepID=UPI002AB0639A|nr:protein TIFY 3-like [Gastrolobium bilobum]
MEIAGDSNVDGRSYNMEVQNNVGDDGSVMHLSANRPLPTSGVNAGIPCTTRFSIFYNGRISVYNGIPEEKVHEIMLIAAEAAKSAKVKSGNPFTSLIPTSPSSPQGISSNLPSPQSVSFPAEKSSICRLQEFPLARRQSLQRFLEKRRNRLGSKAPYASPTTKAAENMENNFYADTTTPDFSKVLLALMGN